MKQDVGSVVAEAVKEEVVSYFGLALKYIIIVLMLVFLIVNIYMSQSIPALYYQFVTEDPQAALSVVKKTRTLPQGSEIRAMQGEIYGNELHSRLVADETSMQRMIQTYEQALLRNQKARDVLYNLYLLYKHTNDPRAKEYLNRVKAIDPAMREF